MKKVSVLFATNSPLTKGMSAGRGVAKKMIIAIMLVFCAATVRAENTNISTSQYYVDTNAATKQDAAPANNANSVMTYDSTSPDGIGAKAIYDTTATYGEQKSALVTAATANAAIQNGINSEFVCANPPKCNLWDLKGFYPTSLPAGYTELEYIESTGTQYIDTGFTTNGIGLSIDVKVVFLDNSSEQAVCGREAGGGFECARSNGGVFLYNQYDKSVSFTPVYANTVYSIQAGTPSDDMFIVVNGVLQKSNMAPVARTPASFNLFRHNFSYYAKIKMYYFKLYNNGTLVRDFVPARQDSTGTLGMYDTVTNTFFTNAATSGDDFIAGPVASYIPQNQ